MRDQETYSDLTDLFAAEDRKMDPAPFVKDVMTGIRRKSLFRRLLLGAVGVAGAGVAAVQLPGLLSNWTGLDQLVTRTVSDARRDAANDLWRASHRVRDAAVERRLASIQLRGFGRPRDGGGWFRCAPDCGPMGTGGGSATCRSDATTRGTEKHVASQRVHYGRRDDRPLRRLVSRKAWDCGPLAASVRWSGDRDRSGSIRRTNSCGE